MLKNIPANLQGYKLMVTEAPTVKMRENERTGEMEAVLDFQGNKQFVVALLAKRRPEPGQYAGKGEEIRVTLSADPGEGFEEGMFVQLIDATISHWQNERNGRFSSGLSFRAAGLTPMGVPVPQAA